MDMETAKAYFTTVAEREAAAPDFCRANFLDASALVKLHVVEEGAAIIRAYFDREPTSYTTPFCFYEALTLLKVKWLYRKEITKEQYLYAASGLSAWYGAVSRDIKDLDFTLPKTFADARRIAERTSLDLSDAFQILSVKAGYYSGLARESATILVTADQPLAKAAKAEGLCRVWYFMKEPAP